MTNEIKDSDFNNHQRIILVASEFDDQTKSAVAWLNSNDVDISCFQICPYKLGEDILIDMQKILPLAEYDDFYVNISNKGSLQKNKKKDITRQSLPKIDAMLGWGVIKAGDVLVAKGTDKEAILQTNGQVETEEGVQSLQKWLKSVYGWSSVQTYAFTVLKEDGRTLSEIRTEYMSNNLQG